MTSKPTKNQPTPPPDQLTAREKSEASETNEKSEKAKAVAANQASQSAKVTPKTEAKTEPKKKKPWSAPVLQFLDEEESDGKTSTFHKESYTTTLTHGRKEYSGPS